MSMEPFQITERLWDLTPDTIYGILVVLLFFANVIQWRKNQALVEMLLEMQREVVPTNQAVLNFMAEVRDHVKDMKEGMLQKLLSK